MVRRLRIPKFRLHSPLPCSIQGNHYCLSVWAPSNRYNNEIVMKSVYIVQLGSQITFRSLSTHTLLFLFLSTKNSCRCSAPGRSLRVPSRQGDHLIGSCVLIFLIDNQLSDIQSYSVSQYTAVHSHKRVNLVCPYDMDSYLATLSANIGSRVGVRAYLNVVVTLGCIGLKRNTIVTHSFEFQLILSICGQHCIG